MLLALVLCVLSIISPTICVRKRYSGTKTKVPTIFENNNRVIKQDRHVVKKANKSYTIPPAYRSECESIQPCLDRTMQVMKYYAEIIQRFDGENKTLQFQDYPNYDFLNTDMSKPCEALPYDNETLIALLNICSGKFVPGPAPTSGEVWPRPRCQKKYHIINKVDVENLTAKAIGSKCFIIDRALDRSMEYISALTNSTKKNSTAKSDNLSVTLGNASIVSASVWGALRGIETFNHLLWLPADVEYIAINDTIIFDQPNYSHRGLLVDTARHFISVTEIQNILDAMAMNKMNVFHWHIVDDQSFPIQSDRFTELSNKAAFGPSQIYNKSHLESVREYARDRGIRVMVEIDIPGHTYSWGISHPEIITNCPSSKKYSSPLNPLSEKTFQLLQNIIEEIQSIFPEHYFHFGGDDVYTECWRENNETRQYMDEHGIDDKVLLNMFYQRVLALVKNGTVPIVWEDVFTPHVSNLSKSMIIQTWRGNGSEIVSSILNAGYFTIQSSNYHLDNLRTTFSSLYAMEPRIWIKSRLQNSTLLKNLLGGEACLWGEGLKLPYMLSRLWPRTSAIAEVLWSETDGQHPDMFTLSRIEEHTCRMRRRGVSAASTSGPGLCVGEA